MNKLKLAKKLLKATALALHIKTKLDGPARNKAIYGQVHLKQVTEVEKNLLHALGPFFERQAKSAASKLAKVKNEPNEQQSASELSRQIFNPNDWHEELINRALPPLATSMTKAALAQMAVMGVNVRKLKKAIKNCGTGAGGFKPGNSCARSGGFSATLGSAIADTKRDGRERAFLVFRDGSVSDVHVGDGFSVDTATDPRVYEVGQDIESVHTHPIGASDAKDFGHYTGFSLGDIHTVNQFPGIRKFTVVDLDGSSFTMTRKQSDPDFMKRLWVRTKDVMAEVHQKNLDAFIDGTMSRDELKKAARLESVAVIQKLQSEGFIDYSENLKRADVKSFDSIKASTATEWLENYRGDPADITQSFEDLVFSTPYGDVSMRIATELPTWMKQEIVKHLEQTFSQDYWSGINQTTLDQIEDFLKDGLQNGQSIATMADNIAAALGGENALTRAKNIARTESGNALNGARSLAADGLMEDLAEYNLPMKKVWHSVLGSTTRADHANLDGVPVSSDNTWNLAGYKVRWPGDTVLPPGQRCNCQCTILVDFGMDDETARQLLSEYDERAAKQEKTFREKNCGTGAGGFKPGNTCGRTGSPASGVAGKIVADGLAKSANLGDISEDDANSILSGLQKSIQAGGHLLYLKSVQVVDKTPAGHDEGGLGYSGGNLYITKKFLDHAASNNPDTVRQSLTGTGGERNFAWQDGQNKSECIQLAVAHEVGHHVDSGLFIDWGKAVRTSGLNYTESDAVKVSGYASTHPAELFAELHAFNSIGRRDKIPSNLRAIYDTALKTADPEPMFVR